MMTAFSLRCWLIRVAYKLPMLPRRQLLYLIHQGRWARLRNPHLMTEKINWRVLFDRRNVLIWTCDKLAMKEQAKQLAPDVRVPRVYWQGTDLYELAAVHLPHEWVLKPNHRSELVHFGSGPVADAGVVDRLTFGWLDEANDKANGEWAYGKAQRVLFVEESLSRNGEVPDDYKFYVFDGVAQLIQVDRGRSGECHTRRHYDALWRPVELMVALPEGPPVERPHALDRMLAIAEAVGRPFDFLRVDLYFVDGEIWLGEVTPYPASGHGRYRPRIIDARMGSYWTLPGRNSP